MIRKWMISALPLFAAGVLLAHDTWLLPERPSTPPGVAVRLEASSGMEFPKPDVAIAPDRLARAEYRLSGKTAAIGDRQKTEHSLRLVIPGAAPGTVVAWLETKSRSLDLTPAQVEAYLSEIGAAQVLETWKKNGKGRWHETYTKHAKTCFRLGDGSRSGDASSWERPVGMDLEIVPEVDPTRLSPEQEFSVRLLKDGRPLAGLPLIALAAGQRKGNSVTTDSQGRARLRLERPGWWLLKGTELKSTSASEWQSHFTTLTVFVAGR